MNMNMSSFRCLLLLFSLLLFAATTISAASNRGGECTFPSQRVHCGDLTCNTTTLTCVPCTSNRQCWDAAMTCVSRPDSTVPMDLDPDRMCSLMSFQDLLGERMAGALLALLTAVSVCAVAVVAGVGGGGILTPCFQVMLGVPMIQAVGCSQATIVGQSILNMFTKMRETHPSKKSSRPLVNYPLLCFWLPISLVGTMYGNLIGHVLADWARMLLLFLLLSYALKRTLDRMADQRKEDERQQAEAVSATPAVAVSSSRRPSAVAEGNLQQHDDDEEEDDDDHFRDPGSRTGLLSGGGRGEKKKPPPPPPQSEMVELIHVKTEADTPQQQQPQQEAEGTTPGFVPDPTTLPSTTPFIPTFPQYPPLHLALIVAVFLPLTFANLAKNRWADCGGVLFWLLTAGITVYNLGIAWKVREYLQETNEKIRLGEEANTELVPFRWNDKTTIWFPIISVTAGMAASIVGVGGGILLNALFLEAGLEVTEVSATGGFATFAVATEALLQFSIQKQISLDYFLVFFVAGLCSTVLGQRLSAEIKRRGWKFLIVGALAFVMAGSLLASTVVGIYDTVKIKANGGSIGMGSMCPKGTAHVLHAGGH